MSTKIAAPNRPAGTSIELEAPRLKMSYEEYLNWAGEENIHTEWVNGEVLIFMPPKDIHQATLGFLYQLLAQFIELFHLGKIRVAPFEVKLQPGGSAREPDIFYVATENLPHLTQDRLEGPPNLIVEIVSKDSVRRDRVEKFEEYQAAGVMEYWIIDPRPNQQQASFFQLDNNGLYQQFGSQTDDRVTSTVLPGFWLRPAWLWQADTISPLSCLLEIEGVAEAISHQIRQVKNPPAQ